MLPTNMTTLCFKQHQYARRRSIHCFVKRNKQAFNVGSWHQDVLAKRMLRWVWKANGRMSHKAASDHWTRESLKIEAMQGVLIAPQPMHIEL